MNDSRELIASLPRFRPRDVASHKGDFGRVLVIGGSVGMAGAVSLAGLAALRGGAGLVRLAVPEPCLATVAGFEPSYMTTAVAADVAGRFALSASERLAELCEPATCVACGPGLGRSAELDALVGWLYTSLTQPMVVDADALNALAAQPELQARHAGPRILTPHPGEFRRLIEATDAAADVALDAATADPVERAIAWARGAEVVLVLKGPGTLVTDGRRVYRNTTGNPGMATGGSGDVLTGLIAALVAQGFSAFEAAQLGVYLHGRAGDLAAASVGQVSLIASDLVRFLPQAIVEHSTGKSAAGDAT